MFDEPVQRRAIFALGKALQDAWNRGDAAGYAALFTEEADFVAWNGSYGRGRRAIEDAHRRLFDGPLAGSRMVLVDDGAESAPPGSLRPAPFPARLRAAFSSERTSHAPPFRRPAPVDQYDGRI